MLRVLLYCSAMSSSPLPSAPLADRLSWLAGEVRSEKDEAGMIVAVFIEMFARLLTRLAGCVARIEAGTLPTPEGSAAPAPVAAPVAPGLSPRALEGMLPVGGPIAPRRATIVPWTSARSSVPRISALTAAPAMKACARETGPRMTGLDTMPAPMAAAPAPSPSPVWVGMPLAAWRRLPASTAGPFSKRRFPESRKLVYFVALS